MTTPRRILITGGSSGLGLALAHALAARGDQLALVARNPKKLEEAAAEIRRATKGAVVHVRALDVSDAAALQPGIDAIARELGGIDVLVNSAGILREGHFETLPESVHREVMETNYFGALNVTRAALPHLRRSGRGHLVNISSIAGLSGVFGYSAYCASKYAVLGLSETLRVELAPQGIRVQVVCPGEFDSPMVDDIDRYRSPENKAHAHTIPKVTVDVVVRDTLRGMARNTFMIVPGAQARLTVLALQHLPGVARWLGDRTVRGVYRGPQTGN